MRLDRDALDMIATARIFADIELLPAEHADCGCGGADHDECALANSYTVRHEAPAEAPRAADVAGMISAVDVDGPDTDPAALLVAAIIGASQVVIHALLAIIDTDDEARLAMAKNDMPGTEGKRTDIDPTLFAAWADTRDMAKHWAEQARARELEVRAEMGDAMTGLVDGKPAIVRIKRTEAVRAHPRNVDYLKPVGAYLGVL